MFKTTLDKLAIMTYQNNYTLSYTRKILIKINIKAFITYNKSSAILNIANLDDFAMLY